MNWYLIVLSVLSIHSMMSMEIDLLHQIPDAYAHKVKKEIRNKGPKKMLNLVEHACSGNLALKAYVMGQTWLRTDFCTNTNSFFTEIAAQAKKCDDQLALQVCQIMQQGIFHDLNSTRLITHAILLNKERGLGFLIQMGENLRPEHLSLTIEKGLPQLTDLLLEAGCPIETRSTWLNDHPFVVAVKKRDERAVRHLLSGINPKNKFLYNGEGPAVTIEEYLTKEDHKYTERIEYDLNRMLKQIKLLDNGEYES